MNFLPIHSFSISSFINKQSLLPTLNVLQKKIVGIALFAFGCLSVSYLIYSFCRKNKNQAQVNNEEKEKPDLRVNGLINPGETPNEKSPEQPKLTVESKLEEKEFLQPKETPASPQVVLIKSEDRAEEIEKQSPLQPNLEINLQDVQGKQELQLAGPKSWTELHDFFEPYRTSEAQEIEIPGRGKFPKNMIDFLLSSLKKIAMPCGGEFVDDRWFWENDFMKSNLVNFWGDDLNRSHSVIFSDRQMEIDGLTLKALRNCSREIEKFVINARFYGRTLNLDCMLSFAGWEQLIEFLFKPDAVLKINVLFVWKKWINQLDISSTLLKKSFSYLNFEEDQIRKMIHLFKWAKENNQNLLKEICEDYFIRSLVQPHEKIKIGHFYEMICNDPEIIELIFNAACSKWGDGEITGHEKEHIRNHFINIFDHLNTLIWHRWVKEEKDYCIFVQKLLEKCHLAEVGVKRELIAVFSYEKNMSYLTKMILKYTEDPYHLLQIAIQETDEKNKKKIFRSALLEAQDGIQLEKLYDFSFSVNLVGDMQGVDLFYKRVSLVQAQLLIQKWYLQLSREDFEKKASKFVNLLAFWNVNGVKGHLDQIPEISGLLD